MHAPYGSRVQMPLLHTIARSNNKDDIAQVKKNGRQQFEVAPLTRVDP